VWARPSELGRTGDPPMNTPCRCPIKRTTDLTEYFDTWKLRYHHATVHTEYIIGTSQRRDLEEERAALTNAGWHCGAIEPMEES
jgi:hypothetical protein